ncbi:MAG: DUF4244 domain-containing protein [Acidimicrobiales bacterium]|jgi:hypothetical protein|nr:DUF4244 domain-containing protein [Acidimicrobiales bacterium]
MSVREPFLRVAVLIEVLTVRALPDARLRGDRGQATAEYALVLLGAAAIAMLLVAWATQTDRIGKLFDWVMSEIIGRAK